MTGPVGARCLVYAPYSFSGRGPAESCAQIAAGMVGAGLPTTVFAGRRRFPLASGVDVHEPLGLLGRQLPWQILEPAALRLLEIQFRSALRHHDAASTVIHFWPGSPRGAVIEARERGFVTVREMINAACATSGPILNGAYARLGLPATHPVTTEVIAGETEELALYDYFFASNPEVEKSLWAIGVAPERILPATFGWDPTRYAQSKDSPIVQASTFTAAFVGRVGVRKGVPELLEAWERAGIDGELVLAGPVDDEIADLVRRHTNSGSVRTLGYVANPSAIYRSSHVFVFPTLEEGGPQVTYEAAGCGLPIITTPMGAARLVETGRNGIVVNPADVGQLATALRLLADQPGVRAQYAEAAEADAQKFAYPVVGARRAERLLSLLR